jgi:hypothetical protein
MELPTWDKETAKSKITKLCNYKVGRHSIWEVSTCYGQKTELKLWDVTVYTVPYLYLINLPTGLC